MPQERLRVLYWTQLFWPYIGGVEVHSAQFLPAMQARGYDFAVVTSHGSLDLPDEDVHQGIPIYRFPFQSALAKRNMKQFWQALEGVTRLKRAFQPHLVHVNFTDPSVLFHLQTAKVHPSLLLVSLRLGLPPDSGGPDTLLGQTLRSAHWVTVNSAAMLAHLHELAPDIHERSSLIYNGLQIPTLLPSPLLFDPPILLCFGRIVQDKGFDLALRAFGQVVARFPQARLVIAGDGPQREALQQLARVLGLADVVHFPGWIAPQEIPALINTATVVVMPSRWREAFGLVALEAALMVRPVVATRVGGLPEVVQEGQTGLLVDKESPALLAEAILSLLEHPERAIQLGQNARQRALERFSWERHLNDYDALYQKLITGVTNAHVTNSPAP